MAFMIISYLCGSYLNFQRARMVYLLSTRNPLRQEETIHQFVINLFITYSHFALFSVTSQSSMSKLKSRMKIYRWPHSLKLRWYRVIRNTIYANENVSYTNNFKCFFKWLLRLYGVTVSNWSLKKTEKRCSMYSLSD